MPKEPKEGNLYIPSLLSINFHLQRVQTQFFCLISLKWPQVRIPSMNMRVLHFVVSHMKVTIEMIHMLPKGSITFSYV
jgi:hypothetical protein